MKRLALFLIKFLSRYTYQSLTVGDETRKVKPVTDTNGKPLILHYDGQDHTMWTYKNENDMRIARSIWLRFFDNEKNQNITTDMLERIATGTIEALNKHDYSKASFNQVMLLDMVKNLTPMDVLINEMAVLIFDENEDLKAFDGDIHAKKVKAMKAHPDQGFFLSTLMNVGNISGEGSLKDILASLKQSTARIRSYERMLTNQ